MKETPNMHIGEKVQVTLSEDLWFLGTIAHGDATVVKVNGPEDQPELTDYYPTDSVQLV
jgi:hypothetical protein